MQGLIQLYAFRDIQLLAAVMMLMRWFGLFSLSLLSLTECLLQIKQSLTFSESKTGVHLSLRELFS